MANLVGKLGQTIQGSVQNFGAGFKQAAISGNPALFGAGLAALEKAFQKSSAEEKAERQKDREERRRDKQFNEENQNEQRKLDNDILGTLKSIEKSVEAILGVLTKKDKAGYGLGPLALLAKGIEQLVKGLTKGLDALKKFFTVKIPDFFKNIFEKLKMPAITGALTKGLTKLLKGLVDLIENGFNKLKLGFAERFPKLQKGIDQIFDVIRNSIRFVGNIMTDLFNRVAQLVSRLVPALPGAPKAPTIKQEGTRFRSTETGKFVSADSAKAAGYLDEAGKAVKGVEDAADVAKVGIVGAGLAKILGVFKSIGDVVSGPLKVLGEVTDVLAFARGLGKVIVPLGIIISIFDGIFNAIDTAALEKQFGPGNVGIQQRIAGFIGGFIGSIGGLFDVLGKLMGIDTGEGENSIQGQLTAFFTKVSDEVLSGISAFFKFIGTVITSETFQEIWKTAKETLSKGFEAVLALFGLIKDIFMSDTMMYIYKVVGNIIGEQVKMALKALGNIVDFIIGLITFDTAKMSGAVSNLAGTIVEGVGNVFKIIANTLIEGLNSVVQSLPLPQSLKDKMKIGKFVMLTKKDKELDALSATVGARPKDAAGAAEWNKQYGKFYDPSGKLKASTLQEQTELRKLIADGTYDAMKRPGSYSWLQASNIIANTAEDEFEWQQKQAQKTEQYQKERDALQDRFYGTLENGFERMFTKMAGPGGFGSTAEGAPRNAIQKALGPAFEKIGTKIFGKEMGGEIGQIFTELAGSYGEQIAQQVIGPALFGGTEQGSKNANRFFNSLAAGNKKAALEDFFYGISGGNIRIGARSAIGYEEGAKELAKELAGLTGAPFDPLFNLDKKEKQDIDQAKRIYDPIVKEVAGLRQDLKSAREKPGGGTSVVTAEGVTIAGGPDPEYYDAYGIPHDPLDIPSTASTPFAGPMPKSLQLLTDLGANYLGSRLGVNTGTFGGSMAQAGINQVIGNILSGQQLTGGLAALGNPALMLGSGIAQAGVMMGSAGMSQFGGAMGLGATGGFQNLEAFSNLSTVGQAGYVAGVIGAGLRAKAISDAFSGGYKSGVGDAVAVIGSFFDPTGGMLSGAAGAFINRLFGRKAPEVTDSGITGTLKTDSASLRQYTDILEKGGTYRSDKRYTRYSELPPEVSRGIVNAITAMTEGIKDVGKLMGFDAPKRNEVFASSQRTVKLSDYSAEDQEFIKGLKEGSVARLPSGELIRLDQFVAGGQTVYRRREYDDSGQRTKDAYFRTNTRGLQKVRDDETGQEYYITTDENERYPGIYDEEFVKDLKETVTFTTISAGDAYRAAYQKLLSGDFEQQVRVSLKGKSEEEIKEALTKMVEDFADAYITDAFGNVLDRFAKEGERLFETYDRLAQATAAIADLTMKLRYEFEFLNLHMDEFEAAQMASTFFELAGGVDKYAADLQFYFENFYTKEEQLEYAIEKTTGMMQKSLEMVGLESQHSVESLTGMMGETFDDAAKAYRKIVDDFIEANGGMEEIVRKGDPQVIEQLARMQGELAQEYYATARAMQELDRIKGTSKENLTTAARAIFEADMAAMGRSLAVGGVTSGPRSGYAAMLHGTEAVVPLPNGREIPVELQFPQSELGLNRTYINNIIGNGNATVRSQPTNVITSPPQATSGSSPNRVLSSAY